MDDGEVETITVTITDVVGDETPLVSEDVFIPQTVIGYDVDNNPLYPDPESTDPIGDILPPAVIPNVPTPILNQCLCDVYTDLNGIYRIDNVTVAWNASTGAEYYQVFFIEDNHTSLKYYVEGQEFGGYTDGPLFSFQSGEVTNLTYTFKTNAVPKRINAFVFAYSSAGRSEFPLTMVTFIGSNKLNGLVNDIFLERTSYIYKPAFSYNLDDGTQDLGGSAQNLSNYKAGVTKVDPVSAPLSSLFRFDRCKVNINREVDPAGTIENMSIAWKPVEKATGYQVYFTTNHNELSGKAALEDPDYEDTRMKESYSLGPLFFHQSGILDSKETFYYYEFDPGMFTKCSVFVFAYNDIGRSSFPRQMLSAISFVPGLEIGLGLLAIERTRYVAANGDITTIDDDELADFQANNLNITTRILQ